MSWKRIWTMFKARNYEFFRDTAAFGWNFLFPFLIIAGFAVAFSGRDFSGIPVGQRPGGARIYNHLKSKDIEAVILYTIDRTARDKRDYPIEFLIFLRDIQDSGAELHYVDTGKSEGSIISDLFKAWQAGEERKKIAERSIRGRMAKAKAG